jgi:hypothetical protein
VKIFLPANLRIPHHMPHITAPSLRWCLAMGLIYSKTIIYFSLRHPLDYTNRNVFFDSTYTAEYLTTHGDFYLHVEQAVFVFFCFLLSRVLLLVVSLVVYVFVAAYPCGMTDVKPE